VSDSLKIALLDRLQAERRISPQQRRDVLAHAQTENVRIEDALVETGVLDEATLLKWLAALHKTHFVSTEKLAKTEVERSTLALIPRQLAERLCVFPVLFSAKENSLAFVLADPDDAEIAREVRLAASVPNVKPLVARPLAVRAAIQKHYAGDIHAFGKVDQRSVQQFHQMMDTYERNVFDSNSLGSAPRPTPREKTAVLPPPPPISASKVHDATALERSVQQVAAPAAGIPYASGVELVNVLVSLLENPRQELRGHSAQVARLMQKLGEHMGLEASEVYALRLTGLLHDVGKTSSYHLTALNVAEYEGHRTQAKKSFLGPVRLFDSALLPKACVEGLTHVYERFDGAGFPDRRAGKDIPLAARILAIAETYADLTSNARNPFRRTLTAKGTIEVLTRYKDKIFDGNLVDLFRVAALGEDLQSSLLGDRPRILLIDADAEETTVLELRLAEQGYEVVLCRGTDQAFALVQQGGIDALICEVELKPHDGFTLIEQVRKQAHGGDLPVLFLTRKSDRASVDRGFALGAADYIIKPASPDVVVAKVRNVLAKGTAKRATRGVSGSLAEMPLPDVLQVLSRTRKTGSLRISAGGHRGEIQFGNGEIHEAKYRGLLGEDAVYELLALADGEFALDPTFVPTSRSVHASTEHLLLEGMRRMDEAGFQGGATGPLDYSTTRLDD
jgi:response regulator RpfG family c-di-GMP phosphodiesterase